MPGLGLGMKVRAFAVDVDGTITTEDGTVDLEAASVLRNLEKMGYRVVLVSGRSGWELYALSMYLGLCGVVVGENGGVTVFKSPLNIRLWSDNTEPLLAYEHLTRQVSGLTLRDAFPRFTEVVLERTVDVNLLRSKLREGGFRVKVLDSGYALHISSEGVDKGTGVLKALSMLSVQPSEAVAIGDSETDVPMFLACGFSIAVGNADVPARSAARHVTAAHMGAGVVEGVGYVLENLISEPPPSR
jgi:phosphoglycolate phosphatase (TIGR01487 family)